MSQLAYMTKRGAGVVLQGSAAELGARMMRLKTIATLRSDHGAIIGTVTECDGGCDEPCPGKGWHCFYDPTGDNVRPEPLVRMDEDDMEYPLPKRILAPSGTSR